MAEGISTRAGKKGSRETPRGFRQALPCQTLWERAPPEPGGGLQACSMETVSRRPASQPSRADATLEVCLVA